MFRRKPNVRIIYKSGAVMDLRAEQFKVKYNGSQLVTMAWSHAEPRPLHAGIDEVAAVWELR